MPKIENRSEKLNLVALKMADSIYINILNNNNNFFFFKF